MMPPHRRRRGALSEQEQADWGAFAASIRPLPGRAAPAAPAPPPPEPLSEPPRVVPLPRPRGPLAPLAVGEAPAGLDAASWSRFRAGRLDPERALDLHGRTAEQAHGAFRAFLRAAAADDVRCVEIITGRGSGEGGGVLRREFRHWLNDPAVRPLVLAAAHPHAANQGAVRLLLRRRR